MDAVVSENNAYLSQVLNEAAAKILTDVGQGVAVVGMVTTVPVPRPPNLPWWKFWVRHPQIVPERRSEMQLMPATTVRDGNSLQFEAEGFAGWTWREGERFVEFVLCDSAGRTLMSGGKLTAIPQPGYIVHPPRIDISVQVEP